LPFSKNALKGYAIHGSSYGLTETFTIVSMNRADVDPEIKKRTTGKALPGAIFRIVDPETGQPMKPGEEGEITVKGQTFMKGYYKRLPEEYLDQDGFFHTKDGGYFDHEGYLHWKGRLSNMIKTGGANVSPLEIDMAAAEMPELRVSMAVGVPHATFGEVVVLCAVKTEGSSVDAEQVRQFLRGKLSAYKVPKVVLFFEPSELSFTGTAKLQAGPLREKALARLQRESVEIDGHTY
jgi:acyl-CoA synthetase (AMP-forming)/AMP-acid ligase II